MSGGAGDGVSRAAVGEAAAADSAGATPSRPPPTGWTSLPGGTAGAGGAAGGGLAAFAVVGAGGCDGDAVRDGVAHRGGRGGAAGVSRAGGGGRADPPLREPPDAGRLGGGRVGARLAGVVPGALRGAPVERAGAAELRRVARLAGPRVPDEVRPGDPRGRSGGGGRGPRPPVAAPRRVARRCSCFPRAAAAAAAGSTRRTRPTASDDSSRRARVPRPLRLRARRSPGRASATCRRGTSASACAARRSARRRSRRGSAARATSRGRSSGRSPGSSGSTSMIGNDVVDLGDADSRIAGHHPRFDERVFAPAERALIAPAPAASGCAGSSGRPRRAPTRPRRTDARAVFSPRAFSSARRPSRRHRRGRGPDRISASAPTTSTCMRWPAPRGRAGPGVQWVRAARAGRGRRDPERGVRRFTVTTLARLLDVPERTSRSTATAACRASGSAAGRCGRAVALAPRALRGLRVPLVEGMSGRVDPPPRHRESRRGGAPLHPRGEDAARARGLRPRAVVLYTDVDRDAPFVRHADAAVRLPAAPAPRCAPTSTTTS